MWVATSMNVLYDYTDDVERAVRRLAEAGFEALDFNGCDMMQLWRGPLGDELVDRIKVAADQHGLPFVQSHGPMFDYWGEKAEENIADTFRCIDWCGRLGVPWMVMHPAAIAGGYDRAHHQATLAANLKFLGQFLPALERHGVGLAIENTADGFGGIRRFGAVPEDLCELCDAFDHELVGLCWDTGHAFLQKLPQREAIGSLGSRLKVLHVQDNDGKSDHHLLPFNGKIDWNEVVLGLKQAGFAGHWTFETHAAVRFLPDPLRDAALRLAAGIGKHFAAMF